MRGGASEQWVWESRLPGSDGLVPFVAGQGVAAQFYFGGTENRTWTEFAVVDDGDGRLRAAGVLVDGRWLPDALEGKVPGVFSGFLLFSGAAACPVNGQVTNSFIVSTNEANGAVELERSVSDYSLEDPKGKIWVQSWYHDNWLSFQSHFIGV